MASERKRSSSGSETTNYQVFLSFRGPDTRQGFTDTLYHALIDAGIRVFRDDEEIRKGEDIGDEILSAIETSRIYVPIFSKNYASSRWCLKELSKMFESKEASSGGSIKKKVLPIFYDVSVTDVKRQTDLYDGAFSDHNKDPKISSEEVNRELSQITTRIPRSQQGSQDQFRKEFSKSFAREVSMKLKVKHKALSEYNVCRVDYEEALLQMLDVESSGVCFVGIHGMGGIGKTTLAKAVFNKLCDGFNHTCFLPDVRESSQQHKGIQHLQKQLLDELGRRSVEITGTDDFISKIRDLVAGKKVLIVLDDVDHRMQIQSLAGEAICFGSGSRIIITSRDKSILEISNQTVHTLEVEAMKIEEAVELFSKHAFGKDFPPDDYLSLSKNVVASTGRLPLALEVIGSLLRDKHRKHWEKTIKRLEKAPHPDVQKKLLISYEALDHDTKQIFLDIACFFINSDKTDPTYMWEACGFDPQLGVKELVHLSLIKIIKEKDQCDERRKKLWMHDQLRDLGRNIVADKSFNNVMKGSRLWKYEDALAALQEPNEEDKRNIEMLGIDNNDEGKCEYKFTGKELSGLRKLRYLRSTNFYNQRKALTSFNGIPSNALPNLVWLSLHYFPEDFIGTELQFTKLVILDLSNSDITEDWGGWRHIQFGNKLKVLNLSNCYYMRKTPNFSRFPCLERLILQGCGELTNIDASICKLRGLKFLDFRYCNSLEVFPEDLFSLDSLKVILGSTGMSFRSFNMPKAFGNMKSLLILSLINIIITKLPNSIGGLKSLVELCLIDSGISELPETIGQLKKLELLDLSRCGELKTLPDSIGKLKILKFLNLSSCRELRKLPHSICSLKSLAELDISYSGVTELPETIGMLKNLEKLDASFCYSLTSIPHSICSLKSLSELNISFSGVTELPETIGMLKNLEKLDASRCYSLTSIPHSICSLKSLAELNISCSSVTELPETIGMLKNLEILDASFCYSLTSIPSTISELPCLNFLNLLHTRITELPSKLLASFSKLHVHSFLPLHGILDVSHLYNLVELKLECFDPNSEQCQVSKLKGIGNLRRLVHLDLMLNTASISKGLSSLSQLRHLSLWCSDLMSCPSLPSSLSTLLLHGIRTTKLPKLSNLKNLSRLEFRECSVDDDAILVDIGIAELESLREITYSDCSSIRNLNASYLPESTHRLCIHTCNSLETVSALSHLKNLKELILIQAEKLVEIRDVGELESLKFLYISDCHSLERTEKLSKLTKPKDIINYCKEFVDID